MPRLLAIAPPCPRIAERAVGNRHDCIMKTTLLLRCSVLLLAGIARGEDSMTLEKFNTLVATPGDTNALRPELSSFPLWTAARCTTVIKLPDGQVFTEESVATAKTIGGKYIVCSMGSQFSKEPLQSVIGYDEQASALKSWGIAGSSLAVGTIVLDPQRRITAFSGTHGDVMQISVGTYSDTNSFSRTLVYKNGVLSLTRHVSLWPMRAEPHHPADASQPSSSVRESSAAGSHR